MKIGNSREQLFYAWRSFSFDENTETINAYATHMRQVDALLGYEEPQILEVFRNTLPAKLYWILFPIEDLPQAVEMAKRILIKEKIDYQSSGQCLPTPSMGMKDNYSRRVTFDTREELEEKIDKLAVLIGKLAARDSGSSRQFKPQICQSKRRGQYRGNYDRHNYDQQDYQKQI